MKKMESVFEDVGKQLKSCAVILFSIGAIAGIIFGIILLFQPIYSFGQILLGFLVVALIFLASWCSTVLLYAFGELVDKTSAISKQVEELSHQLIQSEGADNS